VDSSWVWFRHFGQCTSDRTDNWVGVQKVILGVHKMTKLCLDNGEILTNMTQGDWQVPGNRLPSSCHMWKLPLVFHAFLWRSWLSYGMGDSCLKLLLHFFSSVEVWVFFLQSLISQTVLCVPLTVKWNRKRMLSLSSRTWVILLWNGVWHHPHISIDCLFLMRIGPCIILISE